MIKSYFMLYYLKLFLLLRYFIYTIHKASEFVIDDGYEGDNKPKSIRDPIGSVTEYTYYSESSPSGDGSQPVVGRDVNSTTGGYLQSIVIDKGNDNISQTYVYDPLGNITQTIDGEEVLTTYGYDNPFGEVNVLIQGASPSEDGQPQINLITTFDYDKNGNIIGQTSRGVTTEYEYDRLNRLRFKRYKGISGEGEIVQVYEFKYDNNSNLTEIIYPNKVNKESFTYNTRDLLQYKTSGIGDDLSTIGYTYNENGQLHILTDGEGHDYEYKYDGHGRFKEIIDPLENKVTYDYDANSNVTSIDGIGINGASLNQQFDHDSLNRLTHHKILKESGVITTEYGYNDAGYLDSITTPNLHPWAITPTGSGLTKTVTDPIGNIDTHTYDKRGWLKNLTEAEPGPDGKELTNNVTNNVVGNPVLSGDSIGRDYNYIYKQQKQVLELIRDPESGIVTYEYDGLNRLHKVIRHISYEGGEKQSETRYEYDANGNLEKIFDDDGNETRYVYDTKDRLKYIFYPGNISVSITYNGNDQVDIYTDMNGSIIDNEYDDAGRLVRRTISPSQEQGVEGSAYESFEYDGLGRLTKASNNVSEVWFIYDKAGRLEKEIQKLKGMVGDVEIILTTNEVNYVYDDNGNVTQLTYPSGKILTITPDPLDRIGTITAPGESIASYTYEGKGKVLQKTLQNAITMDATFDNGRRPLSLSYKNNEDKIFFNKQMDWNLVDLKNSETEGGKGEKYKYDSAYRLRKVTDEEDNAKSEYDIDEVENIDLRKKTKKGITETTGYVYNERHQLIKYNGKDLTYDKNGNLREYESEYIYDWKNQLVKVITGTGVNVEYNYDALGRRIEKIVTDPLGEAHIRYIYDGYRVIEEHGKDGKVVTRYTYGNGIDEPVEIEKDEDNDGTLESYIPMQNTIGSVIGIADNTGKLREKVHYDDYGTPTFIYDEEAPQVNNVRIGSGKIFIRFSEPVDKDSAENAVKLKKGMDEISGSFQFDEENSRAIFISSSSLPQNETLTINVTTDLKDSFGNKLENEFSQDFIYTGSDIVVYDRIPPEVEVVKLKSGECIIEFDEEIDSSSITDSIELISSQGTFTGTITQESSKILKFVPENNLSNSVEYTIYVKTILRDLSGKNLSSPFTEKFINTGKDILIYERPDPNEHKESIISNNVLFQGRNFESETGLYYFRARYFHPGLNRFLQSDPKSYEDSMNLYQAFNQNPVNFVDPMGEQNINPKNPFYWFTYAFRKVFGQNIEGKVEESIKKLHKTSVGIAELTDVGDADTVLQWGTGYSVLHMEKRTPSKLDKTSVVIGALTPVVGKKFVKTVLKGGKKFLGKAWDFFGKIFKKSSDNYLYRGMNDISKHTNKSGDLIPRGAGVHEGKQVTVGEHILDDYFPIEKSKSRFISFTESFSHAFKYGKKVAQLNLTKLRKAIKSGELKGVYIISPRKIRKLIKNNTFLPEILKERALRLTKSDAEYLIIGNIPKDFYEIIK